MTRSIFSALMLGAALGSAIPAAAQDVMSIPVGYSDLNLATTAGAVVLENRIDAAVTQICGSPLDTRDLHQAMLIRQCRSDAFAKVHEQVNHAAMASAPNRVTLAAR